MASKKPNNVQLSLLRAQGNPRKIFRDVRNYLAGRFVGSTRDAALLDEVIKVLFVKLKTELNTGSLPSKTCSDVDYAVAARRIFSEVRSEFPEIFKPNTEILLDPESLRVVFDLCDFDMMRAETDAVGDAFEVFVGSESKSREGQFFTPRNVTDLLVDVVAPQPGETIIDPACGAGGFLASTIRYHLANGIERTNLSEISRNLYGLDKDSYLVDLAKVHISLMSGGHPSLVNADSIAMLEHNGEPLTHLPEGGFDVVLTNPPFGSKIVSGSQETFSKFDLGKKWTLDSDTQTWAKSDKPKLNVPPQILFVEQCLNLLRDGGRMGLVLPESLISNKSHRHAVQYLMERADITAVLGMPDALFKTSGKGGTHTKTCLVVAKKNNSKQRSKTSVFMAEAKWCGHDSRARAIPNDDLPVVSENYSKWRKGELVTSSPLGFELTHDQIKNFVLCPHYYDPKIEEELKAAQSHSKIHRFGDLVASGVLSISTGDELGKLAYGTGNIPFIRTSDISNWEIKHDAKHGVSREFFEKFQLKQDIQAEDIFMVKDGTYLIGTCAMVTSEDAELVYQSHIYKIRVNENDIGLTSHILLTALSSTLVQRQIRAKRFTMDIIDSLGDRIHELSFPIPLERAIRAEITKSVKSAFEARIAARKLVVKAKSLANGVDDMPSYDLKNSI